MNKKVRGIILMLLGIFLIYLLLNRSTIQTSDRLSTFNFILDFVNLIFGKMSWFISVFVIGAGLFDFFLGDVKLKFHKSKIIALIVWFLSWSILLIKKSIVSPLPNSFLEAGRQLLEIGFNKESGGLVGSIVSMPLYSIMHLHIVDIMLRVIIAICILTLLREVLILIYEMIRELVKYYMSEDYKKKRKILKAKKIAEKQEYVDSQKHRREQIREKLIESRKQKLSFEISKKPKDSILQKTETYSETELIDKEKEWLKLLEKQNEKQKKEAENKKEILKEEPLQKEVFKEEEKSEQKKATMTVKDSGIDNGTPKIGDVSYYEKMLEAGAEEDTKDTAKTAETGIGTGTATETVTEMDTKSGSESEHFETEHPKTGNLETEQQKQQENKREIKKDIDLNVEEYRELLEKTVNEIFKSKGMDPGKKKEIERSIVENVNHLESVLKEFGIEAKVVNYEYGPTITRYEIIIPKGVKVNKVTALADDIQMNLASESIRIEAPIPGKNTIGIETPNKIKEPVYFSNIIRNPKLDEGALNVILGKNVVGEDKIIDIAKMPHLLIAGTTGSGKSVAVNTLISTLITKKSEKEVKFIMVDPKMVELMPYNGIPHLLVPVIIDPQQAAIALKWAVNEMENRYRQLMENGVRNIIGYNSLGYVEKMPYIVIIIDELADLMMVAAGSVEESIARIAQKARAVGIHLILATQRPSTDVITGMIKANLPSRISFALKSQIDSRTILDSPGAEKLLGQGDMLLSENGSSKLERIQGAFVSDDEVMKLTSALKENTKVEYRNEILIEAAEENSDTDPLFDNAVDVIKQEGKVSISLLQRKLKVGFNRASKIYEQLKDNGIISSDNELLIDDFEID